MGSNVATITVRNISVALDDPDSFGKALEQVFTNQTGKLAQPFILKDDKGNDTGKTKPRFILHSGGYLDMKAYLAAGMIFPKSPEDFQGLHPKDKLKSLNDIDASIYQGPATDDALNIKQTQDAMVGVQNSSEEFNDKALPGFRLISNETKTYAQYAIMQLTGLGKGSFQGMLDILTSDKYKDEGSENTDEFRGACQSASAILLDLSKNATERATNIKTCAQNITSFNTKLLSEQQQVDTVVLKFRGNAKDKTQGYTDQLNTKLTQVRNEVQSAAASAQSSYADYEHDTSVANTSVTYIWVPIAGWISGTIVMLEYQKLARDAYDEYERQLAIETSKNLEAKSLEGVIADVSLLTKQNSEISTLMTKAVAALMEIQDLFEHMAQDLNSASAMMGAAEGFVHKGLWQRQHMIRDRVDSAVASWKDTVDSINELLATDDNIKTEGITSSVVAPKIVVKDVAGPGIADG